MDVAIRDAVVAEAGETEFFRALREIGVSSIEIEMAQGGETPHLLQDDGTPYSLADEPSTNRLNRALRANDVRASAILTNTDFSSSDADSHVEYAVHAARAARMLGAPVVRIDPLVRDRSLDPGVVLDNFVHRVWQVLDQTEDLDLGMENHGPIANDLHFLDSVLEKVPHPRLGLTLDTGNFYWFGYPRDEVYRLIERYAPRTKHTHLKNINFPPGDANRRREVGFEYGKYCCPVHEGNLDLRRVVRLLRAGSYARDLCIEDESLSKFAAQDRLGVLSREASAVRQALERAPD